MAGVTFSDHDGFQKTVAASTAGAAAVGLGAQILAPLGLPVPLAIAACAAVCFAASATTLKGRALHGGLGAMAGALSYLWPHHPLFGLAIAGGGVGLLFARFRKARLDAKPELGQPRVSAASLATAAALTAACLVAGMFVVRAFDSHALLDQFLPSPLVGAVRVALLGFFVSLGSAGAHLAQDQDRVELLFASVEGQLSGDLKQLCARAMTNYRRCAEVLASGEEGFARNQLAKSLAEVTSRVLELARRWQNIDREVGERAEGEISQRIQELKTLKETTRDEVAKKQLSAAEAALNGEAEQIDRIRRGRERVVARLHGEMALLERTRLALVGLKSSDAHLRAAELSGLSESLASVAREMDCEAEAVDEIISRVVDVKGEPQKAGALKVRG